MLSWRILLGVPIIVGLVALAFLDMYLADQVVSFGLLRRIPRGIILLPLYLVVVAILCDEVLDLMAAMTIRPRRTTVYCGTLALVFICWCASIGQQWVMSRHIDSGNLILPSGWDWAAMASVWTLVTVALCVVIAFLGEILRFKGPGSNVVNLAGAVFVVVYIGLLSPFLVQLRVAFGIAALFSLILVTKAADTGAFCAGRLIGRNKLSPDLSPGKTIEGLVGALISGCLASWFWFKVAIPWAAHTTWIIDENIVAETPTWGWVFFGLAVAGAGVLGDLAESLLKREAKRKDSSRWLPGFGGILDIFDSLLVAAPVAYAFWVFRLVCPGYH